MLSALLGLALAADPCPPAPESVAALRLSGERDAYECLAEDDGAQLSLLTAIAEGGEGVERLSRALALYRLYRLDEAIPAEEARALAAVDRRLVSDGIHAYRGRASPAADHRLVLDQLPWYKPIPSYTDARLTETDRANLAILASPPPVPVAPKPSAADAMERPASAPAKPPPGAAGGGCRVGFCGCASAPGGAGALAALLLAALLRRR